MRWAMLVCGLGTMGCQLVSGIDEYNVGEGGAAGAGGGTPAESGCSDGKRDGYHTEPNIAACEGAFSRAGVRNLGVGGCSDRAGDDVELQPLDCTADDLCSAGWHVCRDAADVYASSAEHACPKEKAGVFWLTGQAQGPTDLAGCVANGLNNVVGCGDLGEEVDASDCLPLDSRLTSDACPDHWSCGGDGASEMEANFIRKPELGGGGVLCCRD